MAARDAARMSTLDPRVVASIDDLELSARIIVEGMRQGGNRSPFHGYSTEFRQHRPYRAGDDLKYLDWKLFARSDRLYTRQFRETTNVPVMLVLDCSASMAFPESRSDSPDQPDPIQKFRYAQLCAAALAYVASDQGNAVGLTTRQGDTLKYVPPRGGRPHLRSLLASLDSLRAESTWEPARVIESAARLMRRKGIVIVISDFYDDEEGTARALRRMTTHGHDVSVLQIMTREEVQLPAQGQVEFVDAESGTRRLVETTSIAQQYAQNVREFVARVRNEATRSGIDHALIVTDVPPERALRDWLHRRSHGTEGQGEHSHRPVRA
jgi:uncharacterized protein (DUF58 family)